VGPTMVTLDNHSVSSVVSVVNMIVWTDVKTDVWVTVVIGTVMLVVNLETEVEIGISRAPLGRLAVVLVELEVVDEDLVTAICKLGTVLPPLGDDETDSARVVASGRVEMRNEENGGMGCVVESRDVERDDGEECVEIYPVTKGGVGSRELVSVTPWAKTLICSLAVELLLGACERMVGTTVEGASIVVTSPSGVDVLSTARANRTGCVALG
jgi:hypothetical protein